MTNGLLHRSARLAAVLCVAVFAALPGCGGGRSAPGVTIAAQPPAVTAPIDDRGGRRGGHTSSGGSQVAASLPANWPSDLPEPPGAIQGSTHPNATSWTAQTLAAGSTQTVMSQIVASYLAAGFITDTEATLHDATHRVTIVVENRDHSNAETFVVISVTGRSAGRPPSINP